MTEGYKKNFDFIESKTIELYGIIVNNTKCVAKCYSQNDASFIGYLPTNSLSPKTIIIKLDIKTFKKSIILKTLSKLKENNKLIIKNIDIKYVNVKLSNETILKYNRLTNKNNLLTIGYKNDIKNVLINIVDDEVYDIFCSSPKNNDTIYVNKNQFIAPTIIITSLEKIYYWNIEINALIDNNLNIYIINTNSKIDNKIDINNYDVIVIRNDLFVNFIETKYGGISNSDIIYNRVILDDLYMLSTTSYIYFPIRFTNYQNCLEVISIYRKKTKNPFYCDNAFNIFHMEYYRNLMNIVGNEFEQIYLINILKTYNVNLINNKTNSYDNYVNECNSITHDINICIIQNTYDPKEMIKIKQIVEYYIDDDISSEFLTDLLCNAKYNSNIILTILYEFEHYYNNYNSICTDLKKIKNTLINEINIIKNNTINNINKLLLTKLHSGHLYEYNQHAIIRCLSPVMFSNIKRLLNNIEKYNILASVLNDKEFLNGVLAKYLKLINIINKYILNIEIFINKINCYLYTFKNKLQFSVINNVCITCNNIIEYNKQIIYTCCYHNICEQCNIINVDPCIYCDGVCTKIKVYAEKVLSSPNKNIFNNTFNFNKPTPIDILKNYVTIKKKYILLNLLNHIIVNNMTYKVIIFSYNEDAVSSLLINNNISFNLLHGSYYQQEKILNNLSDINTNLILLQHIVKLTTSINYDNVNFIIFYDCYNCINTTPIIKHNFDEINIFLKKYKKNIKTFYYIL